MSVLYALERVPVNSVVLLKNRREALSYPRGDIALGFCSACGFIANTAFDAGLLEYSARYEATQSFSPTFSAFAHQLAIHLIERYDLHDKEILEIGCGQGEFLTLLCEMGGNRGVGFDPAYVASRSHSEARERLTFVSDFYSERYQDVRADFVCCRMTLEHIHKTADFVGMVRRSLGNRNEVVVFFQVPDVLRVLRELAFWDIYYEHCSYFSLGSLARLFRKCGFDVLDLWQAYGDQYLMIEARPSDRPNRPALAQEEPPARLAEEVQSFARQVPTRLQVWRDYLHRTRQKGRRVVLWGGGSKAVAFLTTLGLEDAIEYVVDINPHKHGTFLPGTGQEVVPPVCLRQHQPDIVLAMNPLYCDEIQQALNDMGVEAELHAV